MKGCRSEKGRWYGNYEVGVFRVTDEVKYNLRKIITILELLLFEEWESEKN